MTASPFGDPTALDGNHHSMTEAEDGEEEDGTAKAVGRGGRSTPPASGANTASQTPLTSPTKGAAAGRLSSIFDTWRGSPSSSSIASGSHLRRVSVSDPVLLGPQPEHEAEEQNAMSLASDGEEDNTSEFERLMDEMGLKGPQRAHTAALPAESKRYLMKQNRMHKSASISTLEGEPLPDNPYRASYGPAMLPKLVPQMTGDVMKRFSLANIGWGSASLSTDAITSPGSAGAPVQTREAAVRSRESTRSPDRDFNDNAPVAPFLVPQSTGGLWGSWWASSSTSTPGSPGPKNGLLFSGAAKPRSCASYVEGLKPGVLSGTQLAKHLISLRVHLSTAKLAWIEKFVLAECGMDALGRLLADLVGKGSKRPTLSESDNINLGEVLKCFRVLLNTEVTLRSHSCRGILTSSASKPGFDCVLKTPEIITHITFGLHSGAYKVRSLAAELLAALCVLSLTADGAGGGLGHRLVLSAFSDYRIVYEESFRFDDLVGFLRLPEDDGAEGGYNSEEPMISNDGDEGVWESRTTAMALVNALTNCPEALEDRVMLREELGRRGLNEAIVVSKLQPILYRR